jgi:citrate lyase subunit beta / citryl-CoA lyase
MIPRSWLFVPGDSGSKMAKASGSGADALILDLEDSVALTKKAEARTVVLEFLRQRQSSIQAWVRINPIVTADWQADLKVAVDGGAAGVVLPKSESGETLRAVARWLDGNGAPDTLGVLPIATETAAALFHLGTYGGVTTRLRGLTWGAEDLSAAIGATTAREPDGSYTPLYQLARSLCLAGAVAAGTAPIETVYPDFRDLEGLAAYAARGRRDGFLGMMAIHPAQVAVINTAFTPTQAEIEHARRVVELFAANPGAGTLSLDGKMLDAPHLSQARRILQRGGVPLAS